MANKNRNNNNIIISCLITYRHNVNTSGRDSFYAKKNLILSLTNKTQYTAIITSQGSRYPKNCKWTRNIPTINGYVEIWDLLPCLIGSKNLNYQNEISKAVHDKNIIIIARSTVTNIIKGYTATSHCEPEGNLHGYIGSFDSIVHTCLNFNLRRDWISMVIC